MIFVELRGLGAESVPSIPTGGQSVEERLKAIGGAALVSKTMAVKSQYGATVAAKFAEHVTTDPVMISAYTARDQTARMATITPTQAALDNVKIAVERVTAAENAILAQLVKGAKTGSTRRPVTPKGIGSRDVEGDSGWRYRQFGDGTIVILVDPREGAPATGAVLHDGSAWEAITAEIGPFPEEQVQPLPRALPRAGVPKVAGGGRPKINITAAGLTTAALTTAGTAAAGGTVVGAGAVSGLLAAAGVSATVPVAGWLVAGGLGLAAATVGIVKALRHGKAKHSQVVAFAKKHGLPDADKMPNLVIKLSKMTPEKREALGRRLHAVVKSGKAGKKQKHAESMLRVLAAVHLHAHADVRARGVHARGKARLGGMEVFGSSGSPFADTAGSSAGVSIARTSRSTFSVTRNDVDLGALILAGFGTSSTPPLQLASFGDSSTDASTSVQKRVLAAFKGVISGTGAIDPREAAAFVVGYLDKKYIPGRQKKNALSAAQAARLSLLVAQFGGAAAQATADKAYAIVMDIGKENTLLAEVKNKLGTVFGKATSLLSGLFGGPSAAQQQAMDVLKHAAAITGAMGEVKASRAFALAAGVTDKDTEGLVNALTGAASNIVETVASAPAALVQQSKQVADQAEKTIAGGINTVTKVAEQAKEAADQKLEAVKQSALSLATAGEQAIKSAAVSAGQSVNDVVTSAKSAVADAGQSIVDVAKSARDTALSAGKTATDAAAAAKQAVEHVAAVAATEVKEKLDNVTKLATSAASSVGEARDALKRELADAAGNFKQTLEAAKASTDGAVRSLATSVETKLQDALQAAQSARDSVAQVPALVTSALKSEIEDVRAIGARLNQQAQQIITDPCSVPALRDTCQRYGQSGSRCDLLPTAIARAACKAGAALPGNIGKGIIIGFGLLILGVLFLLARPRLAAMSRRSLSDIMGAPSEGEAFTGEAW